MNYKLWYFIYNSFKKHKGTNYLIIFYKRHNLYSNFSPMFFWFIRFIKRRQFYINLSY